MSVEMNGAALRAWRQGHGWTTLTVGEHVGYSASAIRSYERGAQAIPAAILAYMAAHPAPEALPPRGPRRRHVGARVRP